MRVFIVVIYSKVRFKRLELTRKNARARSKFGAKNSSIAEPNQKFFISTSVDFERFDPDALYNFFRHSDVFLSGLFSLFQIWFKTIQIIFPCNLATFSMFFVIRNFSISLRQMPLWTTCECSLRFLLVVLYAVLSVWHIFDSSIDYSFNSSA